MSICLIVVHNSFLLFSMFRGIPNRLETKFTKLTAYVYRQEVADHEYSYRYMCRRIIFISSIIFIKTN